MLEFTEIEINFEYFPFYEHIVGTFYFVIVEDMEIQN